MKKNSSHILFITDKSNWLGFAKNTLAEAGYEFSATTKFSSSLELLHNQSFQLILVELNKVQTDKAAFHQIAGVQKARGHRVIVIFPMELTPEVVGDVLRLGAHDCVDKPYDKASLLMLVKEQLAEKPANILIVEDDKDWRRRLIHYLSIDPYQSGTYQIEAVKDNLSAKRALKKHDFDVLILDLRLIEDGEDFEGLELLKFLQEKSNDVSVVIVSGYGTVKHIKNGFQIYSIFDYISKQNFSPDKYRKVVQNAIRQGRGRK